jgi:hypothetical protein
LSVASLKALRHAQGMARRSPAQIPADLRPLRIPGEGEKDSGVNVKTIPG